MADINIFALGGQDENGKNCYVLEVNRDIYVINAGIKVPINNRYGIDGIIPSFDYLIKRRKSVKGIFITHAHDDVFAALPWLIMDLKGVKIYASNFTSKVIKDRIAKYKINHHDYEIKVINRRMNFGSLEVEPFEVANSIVGSYCYKFLTPDGDIVFMSNFIIDDLGQFGKTSLNRIAQPNRKILALMLDARRSNFHGRSSEHKSVIPIIEPQFRNASPQERIIVGAYDEEMYVLQEVLELCVKYNRPVVLYGRTYQTLYNFLKTEHPNLSEPRILDYRTISKHDNAVVLITGTWSRLYQRFVRIAERADVYLKLKSNDRIVMIAPPINGLEVEYTQMLDKVTMTTANITEVTYSDYYSLRPADLDIRETVRVLKPQYFIPISALYRYLVVAKNLAAQEGITQDRSIVLQNGKVVWLQNGRLVSQKGRIKEQDEVIIDGFGIGDISYEVIKEREVLSANGLVSIAIQINPKSKKIVRENSAIQFVGVAGKSKIEELHALTWQVLEQKVEQAEKWDIKEVQNSVRKRLKKLLVRLIEKTPIVLVTFYEV